MVNALNYCYNVLAHLLSGLCQLTFVCSVLEMITNLDVRRRWEKHFPVIEIIEERPNYKIVYW